MRRTLTGASRLAGAKVGHCQAPNKEALPLWEGFFIGSLTCVLLELATILLDVSALLAVVADKLLLLGLVSSGAGADGRANVGPPP